MKRRRKGFKKKKIKLFPDTDPNEGLDIWTFVLKDICPKRFFRRDMVYLFSIDRFGVDKLL